MKYALHVRFNGARAALDALTPNERQVVFAEYESLRHTPGVIDGNQLHPSGTAVTLSIRDGQRHQTNGPVPGAVDGYYLFDAPDLETVMTFAARIPAARMGGAVEIRRVYD